MSTSGSQAQNSQKDTECRTRAPSASSRVKTSRENALNLRYEAKKAVYIWNVFDAQSTCLRCDTELSPEFYSSLGSRYEDAFGHDAGLIRFLKMVLTHLPPEAQTLDLGSGTGHPVATTLAATGHRIHGIDISSEMIRLSQVAVPNGTFELGDMREWTPPADLKPDAIFVSLSLFALNREEIESVMKKCASWLRPEGCLCVGTIAAEDCQPEKRGAWYDDDGRCARDIGFRFMGDMTRITLFSKSGWKELLSDNGLDIVDTMTELFVPPAEANSEEEMHFFFVGKKR